VWRLLVGLGRRPVRLTITVVAIAAFVAAIVALGHRSPERAAARSANHSSGASQPSVSDRERYGAQIAVPNSVLAQSREFIRTAVLRTDLPRAWELSAPSLKAGFTKQRWLTGTIPVTPFPARAFGDASFKVVRSRARDILLVVYVTSKDQALVRNQDFMLELVPVRRHWLVRYWAPRGHIGALPAIP
jgi:hypothetical protein